MIIEVRVNGQDHAVDVAGADSLLKVLRERLDLRGTKAACEQGECGSCSVLLDGRLVCACLVMAVDAQSCEVVTVEGLAAPGDATAVQDALVEAGAVQCGFCSPGFAVAATDLFARNPTPTAEEIREDLSGNLCRCTGYGAILRALTGLAERNGVSEAAS